MPEKFPPPTWADGATPTPDKLREWLRTFDPAVHDARIAADMVIGMLIDERRAHQATWAERNTLEVHASRYRAAWHSARYRARAWFDHANGGGAPPWRSTRGL